VLASRRAQLLPVGAEIALAFVAGAACFALVAVTVAGVDSGLLVAGFGVICVLAVVATARIWGITYAAPVAIASLLAYDWFEFPPTHAHAFPDSADLAGLFAYLAVAVLIGELAASAGRRADVNEAARGLLADEQSALRRVATLVAHESSPGEVFAAVAEEVARLLGVETARLLRYEGHETATVVADWGTPDFTIAVGTVLRLGGENVSTLVRRTGRPARIDDYTEATGALGTYFRSLGTRFAIGAPITVDGRLWGCIIAASRRPAPLAADTESRIAQFTELVGTAISNIQARTDLAESRARIVAAIDEERRRVVRDLHDGAQQRLVHTVITLKLASRALDREEDEAPVLLAEALQQAERATAELRELAHGILPSVLIRGGLRAGVDALASRMPVPIENDVSVGRLPAVVEATAYFVMAEALTNVAKHAHARSAAVIARVDDGTLRVHVRDDGVGGARAEGSGLVGLADRLAVLDGRLEVESPAGGGTLVDAAIPLPG
jgi:signal transduction histidine kinase